jgi:hypothetical protein
LAREVDSFISKAHVAVGIEDQHSSPVTFGLEMEDNKDDVGYWDAFDGGGPSYGRPFLERLLLSLIDAHPNPLVKDLPEHVRRDREKRLRAAMAALFNERLKDELPDHSALLWMAQEYADDRQSWWLRQHSPAHGVQISQLSNSALPELRSARQLAREAAKEFYPGVSDKSEGLRKKWREQKQFWLEMVRSGDDVLESMETQVLAKIWVALVEARVPVVPNWPAGHAVSEEKMLRTEWPEFEKLVELLRANAKRGSKSRDES